MKRLIILIFVVILLLTEVSWGQSLLFEENFSYTAGTNLSSNGWTVKSGSGNAITIDASNLSYPNYVSSSGGSIIVDASGECYYRSIGTSFTSGLVYVSLLVNVSGAYSGISDNFIFSIGSTSAGTQAGRVYIKSNGSNFAFGLSKTSGTPIYTSYTYSFGTTYLIVVKYQIVSGTKNDNCNLYVVSGEIPSDDSNPVINISSEITTDDPANIEVVYVRQATSSNVAYLDGIRISTSWSQAPLPVELTSFTAMLADKGVKLNWETATEVNNYGFEILRFAQNDMWEKIGFVNGHGNSNSPKSYSFTDEYAPAGKVLYRLKQIDFDGKFEYSNVAEVNVEVPGKLVLYQNMPNPFNPATEIKFALPKSSNVELSIYNMLGEKVKTIASGIMNAGEHKVSFNAANLSSGVYFYKLTTESNSSIKKMILMK